MAAVAKTRSRKGGSAVPLDETDKKLLNLLQGSFPMAERPFAEVALAADLAEAEVLTRTQRLLDERIIREITPIFDTRVLGYSSMLVAAKVDPEHPWRAAKIINSHPGVSHNYLRDHDFNLWFTVATEPDSKLGLQGTLDVLQRLTGAESVRQLPTLRLFKISHGPRDGEGHRDTRRRRPRRRSITRARSDRAVGYSLAVIRARRSEEATAEARLRGAAARLECRWPTCSSNPRTCASAERCGAWPPAPSTAGPLLGQGMGCLEGAGGPHSRARPADVLLPRISHC